MQNELEKRDSDIKNIIQNTCLVPPDPVLYFSGISDEKIILPLFEKYKKVVFASCKNFSLECPQKLVTLSFVDCHDFSVNVEKGIIGNLDVFRCHRGKIEIKTKIPFFQEEQSSDIEIWSEANCTTHVITTCTNISQVQKDWKFQFPVNEYSERSFLLLEKSPYTIWYMKTECPYILNEIAQSVFF